jgi:UDP-glucuronate 4-epimerase
VYGSRSQTPFTERDSCDRPSSPYAASKKATEVVCATYNELYDLGVTCLRFFTVYGPGQRPEMAIHKFVRLALAGEPIPMFGDGTSGRDFTYIDDIVAGTIAALDRQDGSYRIYNLGGSQPVLLRDLIAAIGEAVGRAPTIHRRPWQAGDVPITCADVTLAGRELDYAPTVPLAEGLRRFVDWYRTTILPLVTSIDGRRMPLVG